MSRTLTALFDTRADADAGRQRLLEARVDTDHVSIYDKSSVAATDYSLQGEPGLWAAHPNAFLPDEDRHAYEEGVRRGGFLLTADVDDDAVADAVRVLEEANTVDIDERAQSWRSSGWDYDAAATNEAASGYGSASESPLGADEDDVTWLNRPNYGHRDLDRGSSHVRSYGTEPYDTGRSEPQGSKARGLTDEAIGNVNQAAGSVFGNEDLKRDGLEQERRGEAEQGKAPDRY